MTTYGLNTEYYRGLFARQWWIVAVCVIGVGIGAFLGSRFLTRTAATFTSSALVEADVVGAYSDMPGYLATEAKLANSEKIISSFASGYAGLSESTLASEISANNLTGTHLIEIVVTDTNAARAAKLANDDANALISNQQQQSQQFNSQAQQQIQTQLSQTQNQIDQTTSDLNRALQINDQTSVATLEAQLSSLREQQALLQFSLAQMQLTITEGTPSLSLAQSAQPSSTPVRALLSSSIKYAVGGILVGLVLGIMLVVALDLMVRRQTPPDVNEAVPAQRTTVSAK